MRWGAKDYFAKRMLTQAVRIAQTAWMRLVMITFFIRNGFIGETKVLKGQGLNRLGILLSFCIIGGYRPRRIRMMMMITRQGLGQIIMSGIVKGLNKRNQTK